MATSRHIDRSLLHPIKALCLVLIIETTSGLTFLLSVVRDKLGPHQNGEQGLEMDEG